MYIGNGAFNREFELWRGRTGSEGRLFITNEFGVSMGVEVRDGGVVLYIMYVEPWETICIDMGYEDFSNGLMVYVNTGAIVGVETKGRVTFNLRGVGEEKVSGFMDDIFKDLEI